MIGMKSLLAPLPVRVIKSDGMSDKKTISIRDLQRRCAAMLADVGQGDEIIVTCRRRPVARIVPVGGGAGGVAPRPAAIRSHWLRRPAPPRVKSRVSHADLIGEGRGAV